MERSNRKRLDRLAVRSLEYGGLDLKCQGEGVGVSLDSQLLGELYPL